MYAAGGTCHSFGSESMSSLWTGWEDDAAAPPPQLGAGHHGIACWGTGGPHHQGPGTADPIVVLMEACGAGKHPVPEDPARAAGAMGTDGEELGKG